MAGYTKLFGTIITSTVWQEDAETKVIWITLLALVDKNGLVEATIPGISHIARVSIEKVEQAMNKFLSPDQYSRSSEFEGRRIEKIDGGYLILNYAKYRARMRSEERQEYQRKYQQNYRQKESVNKNVNFVNFVNQEKPKKPIAEAKAEAKADKNYIAQNFDKFWREYPKKVSKKLSYDQWIKLNPDSQLEQRIIDSVIKYKKSGRWDDKKFIPHPDKFLKHKRWEDEIEENKTPFQLAMEEIERTKDGQDTGTGSI